MLKIAAGLYICETTSPFLFRFFIALLTRLVFWAAGAPKSSARILSAYALDYFNRTRSSALP